MLRKLYSRYLVYIVFFLNSKGDIGYRFSFPRLIFNLFLLSNIIIIIVPIFFMDLTFFVASGWRYKITLPCHLRWRDKICHVGRRFGREKTCATFIGVIRLNLTEIIILGYGVEEDVFYIKIIGFDEIYNFLVLSFLFKNVKMLKKLI